MVLALRHECIVGAGRRVPAFDHPVQRALVVPDLCAHMQQGLVYPFDLMHGCRSACFFLYV